MLTTDVQAFIENTPVCAPLTDAEICKQLLFQQIPDLGFDEALKSAAWVFSYLPITQVEQIAKEVQGFMELAA